MTARRPAYGLPGSPNRLAELPNGDDAIVEGLADRNGFQTLGLPALSSAANGSDFVSAVAGARVRLRARGSDADIDYDVEPKGEGIGRVQGAPLLPIDRTVRRWLKDPGGTTFTNVGFPAGPTLRGTVGSGDDTPRPLASFSTAASSGSVACLESAAYTIARGSHYPLVSIPIRTAGSILVARFWVGFASVALDAIGNPTTQHVAAFRYSPGDGDTAGFLHTVTANGASYTVTTTAAPFATGTNYVLGVELRSAAVLFWADRVRVAVHTTTLPVSTVNLGIFAGVETLEAVLKSLRVGSVALSTR